jgi:hypothetical protein
VEIYLVFALLGLLALIALYVSYRLAATVLRVARLTTTGRQPRVPILPPTQQASRITREPTLRLWIASSAKHPAPPIGRARAAARSLVDTLSRPRPARLPATSVPAAPYRPMRHYPRD